MSGGILVLAVGLVGLITVLVATARGAGSNARAGSAVVQRRIRWVWWSAAGAALLTFLVAFMAPALGGRIVAVAPAAGATVFVIVTALAEQTWPTPRGPVRTASLARTRPRTPRKLAVTLGAALAVTGALLLLGVVTAAEDGRSRSLSWATGSVAASPYPGVYYAIPMGVALAALAIATGWGLRRIDDRAWLGAEHLDDDALTRATAKLRVLRAALAETLLSLAGLAVTMGWVWHNLDGAVAQHGELAITSAVRHGYGGTALIILALAAFVAAIVTAVWTWPTARRMGDSHELELQRHG